MDKLDKVIDRIETALDKLIKGGAGSGNFGHSGRPGHAGGSGGGGSGSVSRDDQLSRIGLGRESQLGSGGGGGGGRIPEGWEAAKKPFDWRPPGGKGGFSVRLGFTDESRGEAFFDSHFSVRGVSKKNEVSLGGYIDYQGREDWDSMSVAHGRLQNALRPGTVLTMSPRLFNRRGTRDMSSFTAIINKVEADKENNALRVSYTQITPKKQ